MIVHILALYLDTMPHPHKWLLVGELPQDQLVWNPENVQSWGYFGKADSIARQKKTGDKIKNMATNGLNRNILGSLYLESNNAFLSL